MPQIPCVMVAAGQAVGGIAGQWIGPEIYGGGQDWKSIFASHGAGFAVGVLVNWLAMTNKMGLGGGTAVRNFSPPQYTVKGLVHVSGVGIAVDQGLQWLASIIVLAVMRMNTRTFLMDLAASTVGQGLGGIGAASAIHMKNKPKATLAQSGGWSNDITTAKASGDLGPTDKAQKKVETNLEQALNP
jgi:hypothetical protein